MLCLLAKMFWPAVCTHLWFPLQCCKCIPVSLSPLFCSLWLSLNSQDRKTHLIVLTQTGRTTHQHAHEHMWWTHTHTPELHLTQWVVEDSPACASLNSAAIWSGEGVLFNLRLSEWKCGTGMKAKHSVAFITLFQMSLFLFNWSSYVFVPFLCFRQQSFQLVAINNATATMPRYCKILKCWCNLQIVWRKWHSLAPHLNDMATKNFYFQCVWKAGVNAGFLERPSQQIIRSDVKAPAQTLV